MPAGPTSLPGDRIIWDPSRSPTGPVAILISSASKAFAVYRNGVEIGRAPLDVSLPAGQHVYSAVGRLDDQGRHVWIRVDGKPEWHEPSFTKIAQHARLPDAFIADVRSVVTAGTTMVLSDLPLDRSTQSDRDFHILKLWETAQN